MIPVSKQTAHICYLLFGALDFLLILVVLFQIRCLVVFFIDVSRGKVFTNKNLTRLFILAICSICIPMLVLITNLSMPLIFHNYFTKDVFLNKTIWEDLWKSVGIGLVFLLAYKAFLSGKQLTEEQELTI